MSNIQRKMTRAKAFQERVTRPEIMLTNGFDPKRAQLTDLESITLNIADNTVSISMQVPVGDYEAYADYEEVIDLDDVEAGYLEDGARRLATAALRAVRDRAYTNRRVPCETCTAPCCGKELDDLRLTREDVERLRNGTMIDGKPIDLDATIKMLPAETIGGHVAMIVLTDTDTKYGTECVFLNSVARCTIYEFRPRICREFTAWDCELHEEDPKKVAEFGESEEDDDEAE